MPEISEAQLQILSNAKDLLERLWSSPEHGKAVKKAVKSLYPDRSIPELDIPAAAEADLQGIMKPVVERVEDALGRIEKWETQQRESSEDKALRDQLSAAQNKFKLTDSAMEKVVARMKEKNNPDAESVAAWYVNQNPPARPITGPSFSPQSMNL